MVKGALVMHLGSRAAYDKKVCYHDRDSPVDVEEWLNEAGDMVPPSFRTIPQIVVEYSNGSRKFVGGFDDFVKAFSKKSSSTH